MVLLIIRWWKLVFSNISKIYNSSFSSNLSHWTSMIIFKAWTVIWNHQVRIKHLLCQILCLLIGHLGNGRIELILNDCTISNREDIWVIKNLKLIVSQNSSSLIMRKFKIFDKIQWFYSCWPNHHPKCLNLAIRELSKSLILIVSSYFFHWKFINYFDIILQELFSYILLDVLSKTWHQISANFDNFNFWFKIKFRKPSFDIFSDKLIEFTSKFNTSWATSNNNKC